VQACSGAYLYDRGVQRQRLGWLAWIDECTWRVKTIWGAARAARSTAEGDHSRETPMLRLVEAAESF